MCNAAKTGQKHKTCWAVSPVSDAGYLVLNHRLRGKYFSRVLTDTPLQNPCAPQTYTVGEQNVARAGRTGR